KYIVTEQVALTDVAPEGGAFRITGPLTAQVLQSLGGVPAEAVEPHRILGVAIEGIEATIVGEQAGPRPSALVLAEAPGVADLFEAAVAAARSRGGGPAGEQV